ncbi:hypothetical protein G5V59_09915 [Nocardioides sp. W3-2-3]|nr:hypothetical protein [Nocardioides convexus]
MHGRAVAFTAQVERVNGTSTPSGNVQFTVDGADLGAPVAVSGGVATSVATDDLSTGTHTIGARFAGDANLLTSTATTKELVVGKAPTSTVLTSTGSPTVTGQAVTFTATVGVVSPGVGQPAGGVQFNIDGEPYGTAVPLAGDTAEPDREQPAPGQPRRAGDVQRQRGLRLQQTRPPRPTASTAPTPPSASPRPTRTRSRASRSPSPPTSTWSRPARVSRPARCSSRPTVTRSASRSRSTTAQRSPRPSAWTPAST